MFKIYQIYILKKFLIKFFIICIIFFSLTIILGVLEEISFLNNKDKNFLLPYLLAFMNAPSHLFEIFPFIFLMSGQFLFYDLIRNNELNLLKINGLKNSTIIKNLFFLSIFLGILNVIIFYNFSSFLKFHYTNIKNSISDDNKYLAMVTKSGLWIKDEIDNKIFIIKAKKINENFLLDGTINQFDNNFKLEKIIVSKKIDISNTNWEIYYPKVTINNLLNSSNNREYLQTNFDVEKINSIFSDISTLNLIKLFNLKRDYDKLGYSTNEIALQILKISSLPILYGSLVIFACILMLNFAKTKSLIFQIIFGILLSVIMYYITFIFISLGNNGKIPIAISIFFPIILIIFISLIGLVRINEK